jgi:hypothetical protein
MAAIQKLPQTAPSKAQPLFSEHLPMAGYVAWAAMMENSTTNPRAFGLEVHRCLCSFKDVSYFYVIKWSIASISPRFH